MVEDTLKKRNYCDLNHPLIKAVADRLRTDDGDPEAIALRTFYFVRDRILFGFDLYQRKASETLEKGYGACWNKSLLLTGLLRCNGIQARLGVIPVKRSFCKPAIGILHLMANHPYHHVFVYAFLNNRWTILDTVLDKTTYNTFFKPAGVQWDIDWNGKDDVHLYTESVIGSPVMIMDIDKAIDERAGNTEMPRCLAVKANRYVNGRLWRSAGGIAPECASDQWVESEVKP